MKMKNADIRVTILTSGLKQYQIAEEMGISETYLSLLLRRDLSEEKRAEIFDAINRLKSKR